MGSVAWILCYLTIVYASCFQTLNMFNYFKDAQIIAKEVRSSFPEDPERLAELRRLEQVAEHNRVALDVICRLGVVDPSLKVSFEFTHHPFFAVAVVRRSWRSASIFLHLYIVTDNCSLEVEE